MGKWIIISLILTIVSMTVITNASFLDDFRTMGSNQLNQRKSMQSISMQSSSHNVSRRRNYKSRHHTVTNNDGKEKLLKKKI